MSGSRQHFCCGGAQRPLIVCGFWCLRMLLLLANTVRLMLPSDWTSGTGSHPAMGWAAHTMGAGSRMARQKPRQPKHQWWAIINHHESSLHIIKQHQQKDSWSPLWIIQLKDRSILIVNDRPTSHRPMSDHCYNVHCEMPLIRFSRLHICSITRSTMRGMNECPMIATQICVYNIIYYIYIYNCKWTSYYTYVQNDYRGSSSWANFCRMSVHYRNQRYSRNMFDGVTAKVIDIPMVAVLLGEPWLLMSFRAPFRAAHCSWRSPASEKAPFLQCRTYE